ncbi:MAG: hypothetical protein GX638_02610 [Crenarchaeota archaeon]|nr:hypothetical protein [Thermoproteota archaeon]
MDCKLSSYFGYGPDVDLPGILQMLLVSIIFSPLLIMIVVCGTVLFVIMLSIAIKVIMIYLMSLIAIDLLIYLSPIIFPLMLLPKTKSIFDKWLTNLMGFCLQFLFLCAFVGFFLGNIDRFGVGSATFTDHDINGRLPRTVCTSSSDSSGESPRDSIVCIFSVDNNAPGEPLLGTILYNYFGLGPIISGVSSIVTFQPISHTITNALEVGYTIFKFLLIMYVCFQLLKKLPEISGNIFGGKKLNQDGVDPGEIMGKVTDVAKTATNAGKAALVKGAKGVVGAGSSAVRGVLKINDAKNKEKEGKEESGGGGGGGDN